MAEGFNKRGMDVTVVCPMPNYPTGKVFDGFKWRLFKSQEVNGVKLVRLFILPTKSNRAAFRLLSSLSFSLTLAIYLLFKKRDITITNSPPLMIGVISSFINRFKSRGLSVINVSDVWPKSAQDLGFIAEGRLLELLKRLERYIYHSSDALIGQSIEIIEHAVSIDPELKAKVYRNLPRTSINTLTQELTASNQRSGKVRVIYAGLIGVAQGLVQLCEALEFDQIELDIYGEGSELPALKDCLSRENTNARYCGMVSSGDLAQIYSRYDLGLVILSKPIMGAVPSKLFELASVGLPSLYFAGGEGALIVEKHKLGVVVPAQDFDALDSFLRNVERADLRGLEKGLVERFNAGFDFEQQLDETLTWLRVLAAGKRQK
jgi:glycosyltransferase involved in cell wall biosynthesis